MKYLCLILPTLMIFVGCAPEAAHVRAAHKVMDSFTKTMKKKGYRLAASGGSMMEDIQVISLDYETCQNVNVEQARLLFVKEAEALLYQINIDSEIRPYLRDYPATSRNIFFTITFCREDGAFANSPNIAYVALYEHKDRVSYTIYDEQTERLETVYEEPYEEALRIYNQTLDNRSIELQY